MYELTGILAVAALAVMFSLCLKWIIEANDLRAKKPLFWVGIAAAIVALWIVCVAYYLETHAGLLIIVAILATITAALTFRKTYVKPQAEARTPKEE